MPASPGQALPRPPSTTTRPLCCSHNDIPSIQNKHVITNLGLIDAICVPCLLGFSWSLPDSNGHRPRKPHGPQTLAPGRTLSALPYPCDSGLPSSPLPFHAGALGKFEMTFQWNEMICGTESCWEQTSSLCFITFKTPICLCFCRPLT